MPIVSASYERRPWYLFNGHMETIFPSIRNKGPKLNYRRERLELEDGDFLDLDWLDGSSQQLLVVTHGLEGNSERHYVKRPMKLFRDLGWTALAWNCRGCSGEVNRLPRFYHHGATEDLDAVISHALAKGFNQVVLLGFSMGGSMTLKYLGESHQRPEEIKGAVTFSVPCNLRDSADILSKKSNRFYENRFLKKLKAKVSAKAELISSLDVSGLDDIQDFETFHQNYTVPLHGFSTLDDFYEQATCDQFLGGIKIPTLIVNAQNDPLLGDKCFPFDQASRADNLFLEAPALGGHVGFTISGNISQSWMEYRMQSFISEQVGLL